MTVVELMGPPGAGKTTLVAAAVRGCADAGLRPYTVEQAARVFSARTLSGRVANVLPAGLRSRALWLVFVVHRGLEAVMVLVTHPRLAALVLRSQWGRPAASDAGRRRVLRWWSRTAGAIGFLTRLGRPGEALVVDEGLLHRVVQLFTSTVEAPDPATIASYVALLPPTDVVVAVGAPPDLCRSRVRDRGGWDRLAHRGTDEIDRFVANAHGAADMAVAEAEARGVRVIHVDNAADQASAESMVQRRLREALPPKGSPPPQPRPVIWMARPSRLRAWGEARGRPPAIPGEVSEAVLARYGLLQTRSPANLPFGRRNPKVLVATSAGPKVLRSYRPSTPPASILHEHALLTELDRRRFPAVRIVRATTGETLVEHEASRYALFDLADGVNLSSAFIPARSRLLLLETAGRTLARLHRAFDGFTPITAHHLGQDADGPRRDLEWYLALLADLSERWAPPGRVRDDHVTLRGRSDQIASELARLEEEMSRAPLERVIIHGDYGIHNLLYRRNGTAVVTDFELARLEWRLIDIVIAISPMARDASRAFLDGYRREGDIPLDEWRRLPDVWQYYRLTGAVRSWDNYFRHGDDRRLATARQRVDEAARAQVEVGALWP